MKSIGILTGSRAEYGLLKPLIEKIKEANEIGIQLYVTGAHLEERLGYTYKEIIKDGLHIDRMIDLHLACDGTVDIARSMSLALEGFARAFCELKPDAVVILGDRYEMMSAACAATVSRIPIIHLHGGETTEGAFDESFRHAITKMSHLHFTSTEEYRKRVIQLGENPSSVFNVGAIGVENLKKMELLTKGELENKIGFQINQNTILVTFHPVTLENNTSEQQFRELLKACDAISSLNIIFTKANADTDGQIINDLIDQYVQENKDKAIAFTSMGQKNYYSAMKYVGAVVGNSSSGIVESPSCGTPTVNIGDRQKGRLQAKSIINCGPNANEIIGAIRQALSNEHNDICKRAMNPYEKPGTVEAIYDVIKPYILNNRIKIKKGFYDLV